MKKSKKMIQITPNTSFLSSFVNFVITKTNNCDPVSHKVATIRSSVNPYFLEFVFTVFLSG